MKNLQRKLRSKTGASMILALVFLLFCSFVGGSVLVSATANAYRVAHLAEQQDFLNQRSAALLLGDELQLESGKQFRLHVVDADKTTREVNIVNGGGVVETGNKTEERVITFQFVTNVPTGDITGLQRLMLESTVWRYLRENVAGETKKTTVVISNFPFSEVTLNDFCFKYSGITVSNGTVVNGVVKDCVVKVLETSNADPMAVEGEMTVSGTAEQVTLPSYTARFSSGKGDELYDFHVDFGDLSQLRLTMDAFSGTSNEITVESPTTEGYLYTDTAESGTGYIQVTNKSTQTTISWDDPLVEKGGAEA